MRSLPPDVLEALKPIGTSLMADAIESFQNRLANEGFIRSGVLTDMTPDLDPMLGYAVTARVRTAHPPMTGAAYAENSAWWRYVLTIPEPRIVVFQDFDESPGVGAFFGELHAAVHHTLGCVGLVTNGAVRDVGALRREGLRCFARNTSVSRAYAHVAEFGVPVEIGRLVIKPGDLLYGDGNGVLSVPLDRAAQIPKVAREIQEKKKQTIELCRSDSFTLEKLEALTAKLGYRVGGAGLHFAVDLEKRPK